MARAFVAVLPPEPVLDAVSRAADGLRATCPANVRTQARWAPREQWHLTLRFLGDEADLDAAAAALRTVSFAPFDVRLGGVGAFSRPSRARVLWFGVAEGCAPLIALAGAVRAATAAMAPVDGAPYRPHLTVARFGRPADVRGLVHRPGPDRVGPDRVGPAWTVTEVLLVESMLGRGPARHRVHGRVTAT